MKIIASRKTPDVIGKPVFSVERSAPPVWEEGDTAVQKVVLAGLWAIDKGTFFISPLRWLGPTAKSDGTGLVGMGIACGGGGADDDASPAAGAETGPEAAALSGCVKDTDCRSPRICEQGTCVDPPPSPSQATGKRDAGDMAPASMPPVTRRDVGEETTPECKPNESRPCYTGPAQTRGVGECRDGLQNCAGERWGSCQNDVQPRMENCDGRDNDCDGLADENNDGGLWVRDFYPADETTRGHGTCRAGTQFCNNGAWQNSVEPILPSDEACDGVDNDCDGRTDEEGCGGKIGDPCPNASPPNELSIVFSRLCDIRECVRPTYYHAGYCTETIQTYYASSARRECSPGHDGRKAVCVYHSQLGVDSHYAAPESHFYCVVTCVSDADCRTHHDYVCQPITGSAYKACLPRHEQVDIGTGVCAQ